LRVRRQRGRVVDRSNSNLKPETSRSYTFGAIIEPFRHNALTVDYFYIKRDGEIASAPYSIENAIRTPVPPGSACPEPSSSTSRRT